MNSKVLFLFISIFLLTLSACGKEIPDCSLQDSTYEKFTYNEELEQCVQSSSLQRDVCGNGVVEDGETSCNCGKDVSISLSIEDGGCSGQKGEFLEYYCEEKTRTCELAVTDKVSKKPKLLAFRSGGDLSIDAQVDYYVPFMIDRHNVEVNLLLKDTLVTDSVKVRDITIRKVYVVTSAKDLLGTIDSNKKFTNLYEEYSFNVPLDQFTLDTFDKNFRNLQLKLLVSYTKDTYSDGSVIKSEDKVVELQQVFETSLDLIDPTNKNEALETSSGGWY